MVGISSAAILSVCREIGLCSSGSSKDLSVGENRGASEGLKAGFAKRGDGRTETSGAPISYATQSPDAGEKRVGNLFMNKVNPEAECYRDHYSNTSVLIGIGSTKNNCDPEPLLSRP